MQPYKNLGGNSGVATYEIGNDYIKIRFKSSSKVYVYDYNVPGQAEVDAMKRLAIKGQGLNAFVSKIVRERYSRTE